MAPRGGVIILEGRKGSLPVHRCYPVRQPAAGALVAGIDGEKRGTATKRAKQEKTEREEPPHESPAQFRHSRTGATESQRQRRTAIGVGIASCAMGTQRVWPHGAPGGAARKS